MQTLFTVHKWYYLVAHWRPECLLPGSPPCWERPSWTWLVWCSPWSASISPLSDHRPTETDQCVQKIHPLTIKINITSNLFLIFKILLNKVDSTDWRRYPYPIYCRLLPTSAVSVHALWSTGFRFSWHCKFLTRTWDILSHEVRNVDSSQRHIPLIVLLSFIAYLLNIGSTTRIETLTSYHQLFHNSMLIYF